MKKRSKQKKERQSRVGLALSGAREVFLDIWLTLLSVVHFFGSHSSLCTDRILMKEYSTNKQTGVRETDWFQLVRCAALICFKSN